VVGGKRQRSLLRRHYSPQNPCIERIKRRIYDSREQAKADVFDYIEMFYNLVRRHGNNNGLSPVKFERQYFERQAGV